MYTIVKKLIVACFGFVCLSLLLTACRTPSVSSRITNTKVPAGFVGSEDTTNSARVNWKQFFTDPNLIALIDTALKNNQELNITLQEIEIARNEVRARKGEFLPVVGIKTGASAEKTARFTRMGALEATTEMEPGREIPEPIQDYSVGLFANWEVDIWRKLRSAKKAATARYLASVEGRNFMVTNLVAEISHSYYELLALDNQLEIVQQNIAIQSNALEIVKRQKEAARVTELAVKKFEAEVYNTRCMQFEIQQRITETENHLNFLTGRFPGPITRNAQAFAEVWLHDVNSGTPAQLLENRPDIRQAELELQATKLDLQAAKAQFYPSLGISVDVGLQAFQPSYLVKTPESVLFSLAGDLVAPLVNRNGIKAFYYSANARQLQAVYNYEQTILNAYVEVSNQVSRIKKLSKSYDLKVQEVQALNQSIDISNELFKSARAHYMEILMTQRDALEAKFELTETKMQQLNARVSLYQSLGGGWHQ